MSVIPYSPIAVDNVCTCTESVNNTEIRNLKVASDFGSYNGTEQVLVWLSIVIIIFYYSVLSPVVGAWNFLCIIT